jgi:LL-H family phage holin
MINVTNVLVSLLVLMAAILTTKVWPFIKLKIGEEKWKSLHRYAGIAVGAVEQMFKEADGPAKLNEAMIKVQKMLNTVGITFDPEVIRDEIENAVIERKKKKADGNEET